MTHQLERPALPPYNPPPQRSNKPIIITVIAAAAVVVLAAVAVIAVILTRPTQTPVASTPSASAAATQPPANDAVNVPLTGTLTTKLSVCSTITVLSKEKPTFPPPVNYDAPGFQAKVDTLRQVNNRVAQRISPNTAQPLGEAVQDWVNNSEKFARALERRASQSELDALGKDSLSSANAVNAACA